MNARRWLFAAVVAIVVVSGCGDDGGSAKPTTTVPATLTSSFDDPRLGITLTHTASWKLERNDRRVMQDAQGTACDVPQFELVGTSGDVELEALPQTCDARTVAPGNGDHGAYRTIDDVPDDVVSDVETLDTPVGEAQVFRQRYFECTNECNDYEDLVAIVTFDDPADPQYPTLVVRSNKDEVDEGVFDAILLGLADT